ncbi:hypothetical protein FIU28_25825 [Tardiphaga sp. vice154]|uniref:hypothetical protein n=1 Tax=Tardiphaga sp. vice154 TaxID=2592814 RepID=UPI001163E00E|nr:hypothetical protein [Tardiphaga sp. vice154]QDM24177.1 hypothetical protein FIU28_25825 [Tardiphaga sp. vice154]
MTTTLILAMAAPAAFDPKHPFWGAPAQALTAAVTGGASTSSVNLVMYDQVRDVAIDIVPPDRVRSAQGSKPSFRLPACRQNNYHSRMIILLTAGRALPETARGPLPRWLTRNRGGLNAELMPALPSPSKYLTNANNVL